VAWGAMLDEAESDLWQRPPLHGRAREIALIVEAAPGRWESRASYPLAGA